jgi:hypothetical protein
MLPEECSLMDTTKINLIFSFPCPVVMFPYCLIHSSSG